MTDVRAASQRRGLRVTRRRIIMRRLMLVMTVVGVLDVDVVEVEVVVEDAATDEDEDEMKNVKVVEDTEMVVEDEDAASTV